MGASFFLCMDRKCYVPLAFVPGERFVPFCSFHLLKGTTDLKEKIITVTEKVARYLESDQDVYIPLLPERVQNVVKLTKQLSYFDRL
jgi:hypothetical protein